MRAETQAVLGAIVRDLTSGGHAVHVDEDCGPSPYDPRSAARTALVTTVAGGGNGILVPAPGEPVTSVDVVAAAHVLQDAIVDDGFYRTGTATLWPPCPWHPDRHPLSPTAQGPDAVWACPTTARTLCLVGELETALDGQDPHGTFLVPHGETREPRANTDDGTGREVAGPSARDEHNSWLQDYRGLPWPEAVVRAEAEGRPVRVLRPGSVVTLDFRPNRLNLTLDADDVLVGVTAG